MRTLLPWAAASWMLLVPVDGHADKVVSVELRLPEPMVTAIHFDAIGRVIRAEFADETTLEYPAEVTGRELEGADILEFYHLPIDSLLLRDEATGNITVLRHLGRTWGWRTRMEGVALLNDDGEIEEVRPTTGEVLKEPNVDLAEDDLEDVTVLDHFALRLIRYREPDADEPKIAFFRDRSIFTD